MSAIFRDDRKTNVVPALLIFHRFFDINPRIGINLFAATTMLIARQPLLKKIQDTIRGLKSANPISINRQNTIRSLKDTHSLLLATAEQFNLDHFPADDEGCRDLIFDENNELTEFDIEGLEHLVKSISQTLRVIFDIDPKDTFFTPISQFIYDLKK